MQKNYLQTSSIRRLLPPNKDYEYFKDSNENPFQYESEKFELVNAWWLADASLLVYVREEKFVRECLFRAGLKHVTFLSSKSASKYDTQCFVAHNEKFIVVSFRGTELSERRDILTDLKFELVKTVHGGKVHKGFKQALDDIWDDLEEHLLKVRDEHNDQQTIWLTGHSLGAALATIAASRYGDIRGLYTFGSPRVGNRSFRNRFSLKKNAYRFVNNNDIVADLPHGAKYCHIGIQKYIDSRGQIYDGLRRWERIKDRIKGGHKHLLNVLTQWSLSSVDQIVIDHLADHAPILYCIHIWNNYDKDKN